VSDSTITSKTASNETEQSGAELATTIVWSRPRCVQCDATYRHLDLLGIPYKVENLEEHPKTLGEFKALGMMQAPVVEAPGREPWSGYRPDRIIELANHLNELNPPVWLWWSDLTPFGGLCGHRCCFPKVGGGESRHHLSLRVRMVVVPLR